MSNFQMPVEIYMSSPVHTVRQTDHLHEAQRLLDGLAVTSLAVVDGDDALVGVLSTKDVMRAIASEALRWKRR